jgi:branched-chain amino acid transport system permease protein
MAAFLVRVRGQIYYALLTLAFAQLIFVLTEQLIGLTGGSNGLLISRYLPHALVESRNHYYLALTCLALSTGAIWALLRSPFGLVIHAVRDDPPRAAGLGINVDLVRAVVFILSGLLAGVAGTLAAVATGGAFPEFAFWLTSGEALVMVVLGGTGTLFGPPIGAAALVVFEHVTVRYLKNWPLYLGCLLIITVLLFPRGLAGALGKRQRAVSDRPEDGRLAA